MTTAPDADSDELRAELNVTPLVDVVLVLLVILLVVAPRLAQEVPVELPVAEHGREAPEAQLTLTVLADGALRLNGTPVAREELVDRLRESAASRDDRTIFLEADRTLPHGSVVDILDGCRAAGLTSIGIVTKHGTDS